MGINALSVAVIDGVSLVWVSGAVLAGELLSLVNKIDKGCLDVSLIGGDGGGIAIDSE